MFYSVEIKTLPKVFKFSVLVDGSSIVICKIYLEISRFRKLQKILLKRVVIFDNFQNIFSHIYSSLRYKCCEQLSKIVPLSFASRTLCLGCIQRQHQHIQTDSFLKPLFQVAWTSKRIITLKPKHRVFTINFYFLYT